MRDDRILIKALDEVKALIEVFSEATVIIDKAKENYDASEVLTVQTKEAKEGPRWVKASEYDFEEGIQLLYKIPDNGNKGICRWDSEGWLEYLVYGNWDKFPPEYLSRVLILDESSAPESGGEEKEQLINFAKEVSQWTLQFNQVIDSTAINQMIKWYFIDFVPQQKKRNWLD